MKFVIFGAGFRGKKVIKYLSPQYIDAVIDSNEQLWGTEVEGIKVISLEEYKNTYFSDFVIVSPRESEQICLELEENGIYQYSDLCALPSEFSGYGKADKELLYDDLMRQIDDKGEIYGLTAFSLLIQELLQKKYGKQYKIIPEEKCSSGKILWARKQNVKLAEFGNITNCLIAFLDNKIEKHSCEKQDIFYLSSKNERYYNQRISELKNRYLGNRCFIVATGPSLKEEDLEVLSKNNELTMSVNRIYESGVDWSPTFYVCTDSFLLNRSRDKIMRYPAKYKFIGDSASNFEDGEQTNLYNMHVVSCGKFEADALLAFSDDAAQCVFCGFTVTYSCIQLAVYMGFKEIYLLGVDCNYSGKLHFYNSDQLEKKIADHNENGMIKSYKSAKKYADEHGIKIFNATRGGALEVFPRVDFDSLFE